MMWSMTVQLRLESQVHISLRPPQHDLKFTFDGHITTITALHASILPPSLNFNENKK